MTRSEDFVGTAEAVPLQGVVQSEFYFIVPARFRIDSAKKFSTLASSRMTS
jgi:hypothetical protein